MKSSANILFFALTACGVIYSGNASAAAEKSGCPNMERSLTCTMVGLSLYSCVSPKVGWSVKAFVNARLPGPPTTITLKNLQFHVAYAGDKSSRYNGFCSYLASNIPGTLVMMYPLRSMGIMVPETKASAWVSDGNDYYCKKDISQCPFTLHK